MLKPKSMQYVADDGAENTMYSPLRNMTTGRGATLFYLLQETNINDVSSAKSMNKADPSLSRSWSTDRALEDPWTNSELLDKIE